MTAALDLQLDPRPQAVGAARHALDHLAGVLPGDVLDDLKLMVSELVTNSLRHGRLSPEDRIAVRVRQGEGWVRVEVINPGSGFDPPHSTPNDDRVRGWGLYLVSELSDRWAVEGRAGTRVWFEVQAPRREPS